MSHLLGARVQASQSPPQECPPWWVSAAGAGKTYTMLGMDAEPGIYLQTLADLFRAIEEIRDSADCSVSMSYLEVSPPSCLGCPIHEWVQPFTTALCVWPLMPSGHLRLLWGCKAPVIIKSCPAFAPKLLSFPLLSLLPDL